MFHRVKSHPPHHYGENKGVYLAMGSDIFYAIVSLEVAYDQILRQLVCMLYNDLLAIVFCSSIGLPSGLL